MAITRIDHINSSTTGGNHLYNLIDYVMKPEKTAGRTLIGGNSGGDPQEVFQTMMATKEYWDKMDGRLGYHIVISFPPGEATTEQTYNVVKDFCEEYLGDAYDYVFAIHEDRDHSHGHIVFNSVNRENGLKYHYCNGDWAKFMQPVTDRICEKYGLPPLAFDEEVRIGMDRGEYNDTKAGKPTWTNIIKADIDYAISCSDSFDHFLSNMYQMGYKIRDGKHLTFYPPGAERGRRDGRLGHGYLKHEIIQRIEESKAMQKMDPDYKPEIFPVVSPEKIRVYDRFYHRYSLQKLTIYQSRKLRLVYRSCHYLDKNSFAGNDPEVRSNLMDIDKLFRECRFLIENNIRSPTDLQNKLEELESERRYLERQRKNLYRKRPDAETFEAEKKRIAGNKLEIKKEKLLIQDLMEEIRMVPLHQLETLEKNLVETMPKI